MTSEMAAIIIFSLISICIDAVLIVRIVQLERAVSRFEPAARYIVMDSTRTAILDTRRGYVSDEGLPTPASPYAFEDMEAHVGAPIIIMVIRGGHGSFLQALSGSG